MKISVITIAENKHNNIFAKVLMSLSFKCLASLYSLKYNNINTQISLLHFPDLIGYLLISASGSQLSRGSHVMTIQSGRPNQISPSERIRRLGGTVKH
jgi:hypothetical protein